MKQVIRCLQFEMQKQEEKKRTRTERGNISLRAESIRRTFACFDGNSVKNLFSFLFCSCSREISCRRLIRI